MSPMRMHHKRTQIVDEVGKAVRKAMRRRGMTAEERNEYVTRTVKELRTKVETSHSKLDGFFHNEMVPYTDKIAVANWQRKIWAEKRRAISSRREMKAEDIPEIAEINFHIHYFDHVLEDFHRAQRHVIKKAPRK